MSLFAQAKFVLPFAWSALFIALALLMGIRFTQRSSLKALWLNLAVAMMVLCGLETWLYVSRVPAKQDSIIVAGQARDISGMSEHDEILGYAPVKGQSGSWKRSIGDDLIFDVEYSFDQDGLRSAPPDTGSTDLPCVLFFGGSFTLGAGVADDETMPYQVGIRNGGRYHVYNFGYGGYGPHQMLAALEHHIVDDVVECQPRYAIYQMIRDHVRRAAGPSPWDLNGPRYVLRSDGSVVYRGSFEPASNERLDRLHEYMNRSLLYRKLDLFGHKIDREDVRLFVAIVSQARTVLEQRYPGSEFHVIFWPNSHWSAEELLKEFQALGMRVHLISDILPGVVANRTQYALHPLDAHPNPIAHERIADYVTREILDD